MAVVLEGGTERQRAWWEEAQAAFRYPVDQLAEITVRWVAEPPAPGHSEFAATTKTARGYRIDIRDNLDDPNRDPTGVYAGKLFYMETCVHELGHVILGVNVVDRGKVATVAAMFQRAGEPVAESRPAGWEAEASWEAGEWQDHIQEAATETIKDLWLPPAYRRYSNRTTWVLREEELGAFVELLGVGGVDDAFSVEFEGEIYDLVRPDTDPATGEPIWWATPPEHNVVDPPRPWLRQQLSLASGVFGLNAFWPEARMPGGMHLLVFDFAQVPAQNLPGLDWHAPDAIETFDAIADLHLSSDPRYTANVAWNHLRAPYPNTYAGGEDPAYPHFQVNANWPIHLDRIPAKKVVPVEIDTGTGYRAGHSYHQVSFHGLREQIQTIGWGLYFPRMKRVPMPPWPYTPPPMQVSRGPAATIRRSRP